MTFLNIKAICKAFYGLTLTAFLMLSHSASAVIIEYELTDLGGGDFSYEWIVFNDDMVEGLDGFTVYFDPFEVDESSVVFGAPPGWFPSLFPGDPFFGAGLDFYVDFAVPIDLGETVSGFSAAFTWTGGPGGPGDQYFEAYSLETPTDPFSAFDAFSDGFTVAAPPPPPPPTGAPEPATLLLFGISLLGLRAGRKNRHK